MKKGAFADRYYQSNPMLKRITEWGQAKGYDAVIWTDLQPSFKKNEFSLQALKTHLNGLSKDALRKSYCYFRITPDGIQNGTKFGNELMAYAANRMQQQFGENVSGLSKEQCKAIACPNQ